MTTLTTSLPESTIKELNDLAKKLNVPKNQILNLALKKYLHNIEQELYIQSFKRVGEDSEMQQLADLGISDFTSELINLDEKS
ncbi:MAG: hypothetical protein KDC49_11695 [Saprospiraceae bacterium]|nr:hypothetical protein [Saprospiraceae bacterium]